MKIQVAVFWLVAPCGDIVGYPYLRGPCCFNLQGEVWRWRQHGPLKCGYPTTPLHIVTTQKTVTYISEW